MTEEYLFGIIRTVVPNVCLILYSMGDNKMRRRVYQQASNTRKVTINKKTKKLNIGFIFSFYLVTLLFTYILGLSNNFVKADSEMKTVYVDSRVVKQGESLWSIAKSYNSVYYRNTKEYVEAIKECNNLYSDEIYAGTNLIIPYTK